MEAAKETRQPKETAASIHRNQETLMNTRLKTTLLTIAAASLLGMGTAVAGNGPGGGQGMGPGALGMDGDGPFGPADRMARISAQLQLSEDQEFALLEMFHEHAAERNALRGQIAAEYGTEICAQREAHRQAFEDILTAEQLETFQAMQEQRAEERSQRRAHRFGGGINCPNDD
jgi:Spy/CpxP family protein refolding chaperone